MKKTDKGTDEKQLNLRQYIKLLANMLYDVQKVRVALGNRIKAFKKVGTKEHITKAEELRIMLFEKSEAMEMAAESRLRDALKGMPIMDWLAQVKGISTRLSGSLIGSIVDITQFETISQLWSYCGMGVIRVCVECGKICPKGMARPRFLRRQSERRLSARLQKFENEGKTMTSQEQEAFLEKSYRDSEKQICNCESPSTFGAAPDKKYFDGLLLDYKPFLRMTCYKIASQFVKQGSFYRRQYEEKKAFYVDRDGGTLTDAHVNNRAKRAVVKLFLSHLWWMWRLSEGLPAGEIYLQKKLGEEFAKSHTLIKPPHMDVFDD
jgi:hypothetical protein